MGGNVRGDRVKYKTVIQATCRKGHNLKAIKNGGSFARLSAN